ncbi:MAG TPA: SDR family NAD(P)-dependent oxidoreductase [Pirellulales bacterium]|jgi:short-subunit dehydrogenase
MDALPTSSSSAALAMSAVAAGDPLLSTTMPAKAARAKSGYWAGKVALVTGGSSGLGRALAAEFARAGADVVVSARSLDALESAAAELRKFGVRVEAIAADVTKQEQVDELIAGTLREFGRLDVLVNNVGRSTRGSLLETTAEDFAELMDINFLSAVRTSKAALPYLIVSRGHLINIGSLSGKTASRYVGAYSATKFALAAYTQQLRMELSPQGVHVMLVSPGPIVRDDAGRRYEGQLEGLPASAGKPGAGVRISPVRPEKLSHAILSACRQRKPELIYPPLARLFIAVIHLFPRLGDWLVRKMT